MNLDVFRNRNFAWYMAGNGISWIGSWMQRTGIGWLSWELTHSTTWVGLIALAQYFPLVIAAPLFGVLLDRSDRKRYAVIVQIVMIALGFALCLLYWADLLTIHVLFVTCLAIGLGNSAYQSVRLTLINDVVPREQLTRAIGANSILFNTTRLVGPALGGVAIVALGVGATFLINAISYIASLISIIIIEIRRTSPARQSGSIIQQFSEGLRYTLEHPRIRELILLAVFISMLVRGIVELLPAFAGGVFERGSGGLAALMAATGGGAISAGILLSRTHSEEKLLALVRSACLLAGVVIAVFGLVDRFPLAVGVMALVGASATLSSVGLQTVLQLIISDEYRGRVVAFWGMTTVAGPSIGGAVLGAIAQHTGLASVTVLSGVLCVLCCAVVLRRSRQFSRHGTAASG